MDEFQKANLLRSACKKANEMMTRVVQMSEETEAMAVEMGEETLVEMPELDVDRPNDRTLQRRWEHGLDMALQDALNVSKFQHTVLRKYILT
jgi:hypothetical protein